MINLDPRYDFGRVVFSTLDDEVKKKILSKTFFLCFILQRWGISFPIRL